MRGAIPQLPDVLISWCLVTHRDNLTALSLFPIVPHPLFYFFSLLSCLTASLSFLRTSLRFSFPSLSLIQFHAPCFASFVPHCCTRHQFSFFCFRCSVTPFFFSLSLSLSIFFVVKGPAAHGRTAVSRLIVQPYDEDER